MKKNQDYKNAALASLSGIWAKAVVATLVLIAINSPAFAPSISEKVSGDTSIGLSLFVCVYELLVIVPIGVGFMNTFRLLYEENDIDLTSNCISLALKHYVHIILGMLLVTVLVMIGFLLLIIPGIILGYAYSMVPYLLVERPDMSVTETLKASRTMMKGRKFDLFYLQLSFIGWILLSIITLGIGFIWLYPYMMTAQAAFYRDVKLENGIIKDIPAEPVAPVAEPATPFAGQEAEATEPVASSEKETTEPIASSEASAPENKPEE